MRRPRGDIEDTREPYLQRDQVHGIRRDHRRGEGGGDLVEFAVRDTGRGIPGRFQEEVFNKFSRLHLSTDSRERGAGLGLAISKGLAEAHGGRIWVESAEGKNTTFHFEVPHGPREETQPG